MFVVLPPFAMRSFSLAARLVLLFLALASPLGLKGADPLSTWHLRYAAFPENLHVSGIAYGNGVFVATITNDNPRTVLRSSDGREWTRYLPSSQASGRYSVKFVGGLFFSDNAASSDGLVWTNSSAPRFFASSGSQFVGVYGGGYGDATYVSTNGIEWRFVGTYNGVGFSDIAFGSGQYVVMGVTVPDPSYNVILSSTDGISWAFRRYSRDRNLNGNIVFGNGRFVAPFSEATNLISTDGITWNAVQTDFQPWRFLGGLFVSRTGTNFFTSINGVTATEHAFAFGTNAMAYVDDLAFGNGTFVALVRTAATSYSRSEIWQSDPITNSPPAAPALAVAAYPGLTITGTAGREHRIEYRDALTTNGVWNVLTNVVLPSSPWLYFDLEGFQQPGRFYRAVAQ